MRCRYRERIYKTGDYLEVKIYPVFANVRGRRRTKFRPTSEVQARLNEYNSRRHLARIINENFSSKDIWIHPTFRDDALPKSDEECLRIFQNFIRRLKRVYEKRGVELKYVGVCEQSEVGRYHLHIIINTLLTPDELRDVWKLGRVMSEALDFNEFGVAGLANYMTKFRLLTRRYLRSRNLRDPKPVTNDRRYSQRDVNALRTSADLASEFQKQYPGYRFAECKPFFNDVNTYWYVSVFMYRPQRK